MNKDGSYCCFHPREVVVGVCAHCLRDRLLLLLAGSSSSSSSRGGISLPKVFALGSSFLQRLDSTRGHHHRPEAAAYDDDDDDGTTSAASLDDSFISIKFEDNGKATWDSSKKPSTSVVVAAAEHVKRGGRWRKQVVGRLLQLARWKRSSSADAKTTTAACRGRSRGGWIIRTLTRKQRHGDRAWS